MLLTSSYIYMILSCTFRSCYVHRCASFNFLQILWRSNNSHYLESDSCKINNHFRFMIRDLVFEVNTCVAFSYYYITNKTFFRIKQCEISLQCNRNILISSVFLYHNFNTTKFRNRIENMAYWQWAFIAPKRNPPEINFQWSIKDLLYNYGFIKSIW